MACIHCGPKCATYSTTRPSQTQNKANTFKTFPNSCMLIKYSKTKQKIYIKNLLTKLTEIAVITTYFIICINQPGLTKFDFR